MNDRHDAIERAWRALLAGEDTGSGGEPDPAPDLREKRRAKLIAALLSLQNREKVTLSEMQGISPELDDLLDRIHSLNAESDVQAWMDEVDRQVDDETIHIEPIPANIEAVLLAKLHEKQSRPDTGEAAAELSDTDAPETSPRVVPIRPVRKKRWWVSTRGVAAVFCLAALGTIYWSVIYEPKSGVDEFERLQLMEPSGEFGRGRERMAPTLDWERESARGVQKESEASPEDLRQLEEQIEVGDRIRPGRAVRRSEVEELPAVELGAELQRAERDGAKRFYLLPDGAAPRSAGVEIETSQPVAGEKGVQPVLLQREMRQQPVSAGVDGVNEGETIDTYSAAGAQTDSSGFGFGLGVGGVTAGATVEEATPSQAEPTSTPVPSPTATPSSSNQ